MKNKNTIITALIALFIVFAGVKSVSADHVINKTETERISKLINGMTKYLKDGYDEDFKNQKIARNSGVFYWGTNGELAWYKPEDEIILDPLNVTEYKKIHYSSRFDDVDLAWSVYIAETNRLRGYDSFDKIKKEFDKEKEEEAKKQVREARDKAWQEYQTPIKTAKRELINLLYEMEKECFNSLEISRLKDALAEIETPLYRDVVSTARKVLRWVVGEENEAVENLKKWLGDLQEKLQEKYSAHLYSETDKNPILVKKVDPEYAPDAPEVDGRIVLRDNFDALLAKYPTLLTFGEDTGKIGDVNQGLEGLQEKYGVTRVNDTSIRESTIIGQGVGMAMRGLRPIAEIQYIDYTPYAIQTLTDDLATLSYRSCGYQRAPLIVRTRGHRLEGIWHSGSPMAGLLNFLRGVYLLVPRNMTKAAGFYNTLLQGDQPAFVVECLNGYRTKEKMPTNLGEFTTPIGVVEKIREGRDITVVSYGSTLRIVEQVAKELDRVDISIEIIDAQSLIPFDINHDTVKSVQKTNNLLIVDEDVEGGASAYLLQEIVENQNAYRYLDSKPQTLTAKSHRPAYASDGDYFSKPNAEDIFEKVYAMMNEINPIKYPQLY